MIEAIGQLFTGCILVLLIIGWLGLWVALSGLALLTERLIKLSP